MNLDAFFPNKDWDIFESCFEKWFLREFTQENYRAELHTFLAFHGDNELEFVEQSINETEYYIAFLFKARHDEELQKLFYNNNRLSEYPIIDIDSTSDVKSLLNIWYAFAEHTKTDLKIQLNRLKPIGLNKQKKKSLVRGKQLNLADKYHLANEVFGIEKTLRKLDHLSDTEKHILLSQILGCNQQTARELYNGTIYKRTQIQENIVIPYLKKIKGE